MAKRTYDVKILATMTLDEDDPKPDVVLFDTNEVLDRIKKHGKVYALEFTEDTPQQEGGAS